MHRYSKHMLPTMAQNVGKCLCLLILIAPPFRSRAQEIKWPVTYYGVIHGSRVAKDPDIHKGYIVTVGGDTARGLVNLFRYQSTFDVLDTTTGKLRSIGDQDIRMIRVYDKYDKDRFTEYYRLPRSRSLWLLLARKNNISIYRRDLEASPLRMILVTPDEKRIKISTFWRFVMCGNEDAMLASFIKSRYHLSTRHLHLKTWELYSYILDRENERLKRAPTIGDNFSDHRKVIPAQMLPAFDAKFRKFDKPSLSFANQTTTGAVNRLNLFYHFPFQLPLKMPGEILYRLRAARVSISHNAGVNHPPIS